MNKNALFGVMFSLFTVSLLITFPVQSKDTVNIDFLAIEADSSNYIVTAGPTVLSFTIDGTEAKVIKMEDSGGEIYSKYYIEKLDGTQLTISHEETNDSIYTPLTININENLYTGECTDSDGINFYEKGTAGSEDECDSEWNVKEYNCYGDPIIFECPSGCFHGACVVGTDECKDTDNGKEYYFKGTLTSGPTNLVNDYCNEEGELIEYYCFKRAGHAFETFACPSGCENGKCLKQKCSDSDGGKNYNVAGTVINGLTVLTDYCMTKYDLKEYSCMTDTSHKSVVYTCPKGCSEGACISSVSPPPPPPEEIEESNISCVDSDGGKKFQVKGIVTVGTAVYEDECNGAILMEYECKNETTYGSAAYQCPYGCENGKCNEKPAPEPPPANDTEPDNVPDETPPEPLPQKNIIELILEWFASLFGE